MMSSNRHRIRRDRQRPLVFSGALLAEVSTRGRRERWTELRLYRTEPSTLWGNEVDTSTTQTPRAGSYVAEQVGRSTVTGELDRHSAWVCDDPAAVRAVLGDGRLAQELYLTSGLDGDDGLDTATNDQRWAGHLANDSNEPKGKGQADD